MPNQKTKVAGLWRRWKNELREDGTREAYLVGTVPLVQLQAALKALEGKGNLVSISIYENGFKVTPSEPDMTMLIEPRLPEG